MKPPGRMQSTRKEICPNKRSQRCRLRSEGCQESMASMRHAPASVGFSRKELVGRVEAALHAAALRQ